MSESRTTRLRLIRRHPADPPDALETVEDAPATPRFELTRRNVAAIAAFLVLSLVALYVLLPQLAGLEETWGLIEGGDPYWLVVGLLFTVGSFAGYVALFRGVFLRR